jgi:hypothetical protein
VARQGPFLLEVLNQLRVNLMLQARVDEASKATALMVEIRTQR